jgi:hypothetical protein
VYQAKLLVTEWVIGVVLFQDAATTWGLGGGEAACARQARRSELQKKHEASVKESAKTQQFAAEVQILKSTLWIDLCIVSALGTDFLSLRICGRRRARRRTPRTSRPRPASGGAAASLTCRMMETASCMQSGPLLQQYVYYL